MAGGNAMRADPQRVVFGFEGAFDHHDAKLALEGVDGQ
jgi:hypothetical protein